LSSDKQKPCYLTCSLKCLREKQHYRSKLPKQVNARTFLGIEVAVDATEGGGGGRGGGGGGGAG